MEGYIDFLEHYLGRIQYGWNADSKGLKLPFQIVKFEGGPFPDTVTYATLGISNEPLTSHVSEKRMKQEFILVSDQTFGDKNIPGILQQVGLTALKSKRAYLRGEVIGPYGSLFDNTDMEALYVSIPVYFPEPFQAYQVDDQSAIVQTWLVPITSREADFVRSNGWDRFEEILEEVDPDLIDFYRKSLF